MAIPPFITALDPTDILLLSRHPDAILIYIIISNPGIRSHNARSIHVIISNPGVRYLDTGSIHIIPFTFNQLPAGHHPTCIIKIIILTINLFPVGPRIASIPMAIPPAVSTEDPLWFYFRCIPDTFFIHIIIANPGIFFHHT